MKIKIILLLILSMSIFNLTYADNSSDKKTAKNTNTNKSNKNYEWLGERDEIDTSMWYSKDILKNLMRYGAYYYPDDEIDIIYYK